MNPHYHAVGTRAEHRCEYCHAPEAIFNFPFEVEHIVPPDRDGTEDEENFALACRACNLFKSNHVEAAVPGGARLFRKSRASFQPKTPDHVLSALALRCSSPTWRGFGRRGCPCSG